MRFLQLLPLAAVATAVVIPDEQMTQQIVLDSEDRTDNFLSSAKDAATSALDFAVDLSHSLHQKASDCFSEVDVLASEWFDSAKELPSQLSIFVEETSRHHGGHHGHRDHKKPNETLLQLIQKSKYTTKFAELLKDFPEAEKVLNQTGTNITFFVPINKAFEKIPEHHKKPSHEKVAEVLKYHGSPEFYPAGRILKGHTVPSALNLSILDDEPQRLRVGLTLGGLTVNFFSRIVAIDIFGTNGVIHAVEDFIIPPPPALKALSLFPGQYSSLELGLLKTGLAEAIAKDNKTSGTVFAPSNDAFARLGPKLNAFLFSKYGLKYLKAVLLYHLVPDVVLYSDAFYKTDTVEGGLETTTYGKIPKGKYHADLATGLKDKKIAVDIVRFGGLIDIRLNGFTSVSVQDGIVKNGVVHQLSDVLIPPKKPGMEARILDSEVSVEEFKEMMEGLVEEE